MLFESFFRRGAMDPTALQLVKIGGAVNPALGFLKKHDEIRKMEELSAKKEAEIMQV